MIIKAEAIISDLHDKIENSNFKKTTYILHFKSSGFLSPELEGDNKFSMHPKSYLKPYLNCWQHTANFTSVHSRINTLENKR